MLKFDKFVTGSRLRDSRKRNGMSVSAVAEKLGITRDTTVYEWESGKFLPSMEHLFALCRLFGVSMESVLAVEGEDCVTGKAA